MRKNRVLKSGPLWESQLRHSLPCSFLSPYFKPPSFFSWITTVTFELISLFPRYYSFFIIHYLVDSVMFLKLTQDYVHITTRHKALGDFRLYFEWQNSKSVPWFPWSILHWALSSSHNNHLLVYPSHQHWAPGSSSNTTDFFQPQPLNFVFVLPITLASGLHSCLGLIL